MSEPQLKHSLSVVSELGSFMHLVVIEDGAICFAATIRFVMWTMDVCIMFAGDWSA